ncbi:MAG: sigma-70 family RNA polymerase sigma factor [Oscillospiraceae bacterium]|jgi:RNA polymerase sporulation-specific sigma factor|nr:sigma-70 family RNA polymerase sigma factor [Oscillospiraceae bacterium]
MPAETMRRDAFINANMGLVYALARRFQGRGIDFDDLVQAGSLGLVKAADAFDTARGLRFSTYAVPVILGEIKRLFREGGAVKVGRTSKERAYKLRCQREALCKSLGREPSIAELAQAAQLEVSEAAVLLGAMSPVVSLTEHDDGGGQWDLPAESPSDAITDALALRQVLQTLDERDRTLLELRFFAGLTQTQTADRLGMTQVQVSRREKRVLLELRGQLTI